ncbi:MAG: phosphate/phosphite/phosphonate ABC transporter substrate-binding protein [Gammaproteobacteria bacterium]|nr:phosphate/phosphite/phosphonate ABC transporter substrate-binding protein [Gammaproteobacteria bacterium]
MPYNLAVSPDFKPDRISGWFIFNTWLQHQLDKAIHFEMHQGFDEQLQAIAAKKVDIIYANPYDISRLVRDEGFLPVAKPHAKPDEASVIAAVEGDINTILDLPVSAKIAKTNARDVNNIGMILLEPADISPESAQLIDCESYISVAKTLINGKADAGFILAEAFNELSPLVAKQLKPLVSSQIHLIHHAILLGPQLAEHHDALAALLINMHKTEKGKKILDDLGISHWEPMNEEEAEFMIDLMDTLAPKN